MRLALDTNRYTDLLRGDVALEALLAAAEEIVLPFIVLAELRAGFAHGSRGLENERVLARFRAQPGVSVAWPDDETTHIWGRLWAQLRRAGTPIPANDLWIAAACIQNELVLCSRDAHFDHIPELMRAGSTIQPAG